MTEQEKELLEKDICARLPYGLKVDFYSRATNEHVVCTLLGIEPDNEKPVVAKTDNGSFRFTQDHVKPYLRSLSSMTEDEARFILGKIVGDREILSVDIGRDEITANVDDGVSSYEKVWVFYDEIVRSLDLLDYLNARHFDYRGLIGKGLAIEAPEGMYNTKTE